MRTYYPLFIIYNAGTGHKLNNVLPVWLPWLYWPLLLLLPRSRLTNSRCGAVVAAPTTPPLQSTRAQGGTDSQLSNPAENAKYFSYSINIFSSAFSSNLFPRSHLSGQLNTEGQLIRISWTLEFSCIIVYILDIIVDIFNRYITDRRKNINGITRTRPRQGMKKIYGNICNIDNRQFGSSSSQQSQGVLLIQHHQFEMGPKIVIIICIHRSLFGYAKFVLEFGLHRY